MNPGTSHVFRLFSPCAVVTKKQSSHLRTNKLTMIPRLVRSLFLLLSITFTSAGPTGECLPVGDGGDNYHCIASKDVDVTPCKNEESECDKWALDGEAIGSVWFGSSDHSFFNSCFCFIGECRSNPRYMLFNCRKACETCIGYVNEQCE